LPTAAKPQKEAMTRMEWTNSRYLTLPVTRQEQAVPVALAVTSFSSALLEATGLLHPQEHTALTGEALQHYLSGRLAAKLAVSHFTQVPVAEIRIQPGVFGQPLLYCPGYSNIQVSLAHSGGSAMAVVFPEGHPMGVDIEDTRHSRLLPSLTPAEASLGADPLFLWTAREALSKVLKTGLTTDLEILEVASVCPRDGCFIFTFTHFMQYKAISWKAGHMVCSLVLPLRSEVDLAVLKTITYPVS
jgi:4'-phosphopantetheinyl transferase